MDDSRPLNWARASTLIHRTAIIWPTLTFELGKDGIMEATLNIEALVKPITPDSPSGEDLRYSEMYDRIKEARRADDQLEQGEWRTDLKTADWRQVVKLGRAALIEKSKDLQIAVWLIEAWVCLHGYSGLAAGLHLTRRLLQDFWPTLYPHIEDGDLEYRVGPLTFLNEKMPTAVFQLPICDPASSKAYNYYQFEESRIVGFGQNLSEEQKAKREALIGEGKISGEEFAAAVNLSPATFYQQIYSQLQDSREALLSLDGVVNEKFAPHPPGLTQLMEAVDTCAHVVSRILKDKLKSEITPQETMEAEPTQNATVAWSEGNEGIDAQTPTVPVDRSATLQANAIADFSPTEKSLWQQVSLKFGKGRLKEAMDQLLAAAALSPSIREKNRYSLMLAKLCLKADRADLAGPIAEELYKTIETLKLEAWEHPAWIAEVVETLYRCLAASDDLQSDRAKGLFQKLCLLSVTRAAAYRAG
jgi:type VI secretion system protein ImpA